MGCYIVVVLCLSIITVQHVGAQTADAPSPIGRDLQNAVRSAVAERWGVEPGRVELEWGRVGETIEIGPNTPFDIRGRNAGTNFTVVFSIKNRPPMAVGLRAGLHVVSPLATRPLTSGHIVTDEDVAWGDWVRWGTGVHDAAANELPIGWRVRTTIATGQPVKAPTATPPPTIRSGSTVEVVWRKRGVEVRVMGVAMHNAVAGQLVRVRLENGRGSVRGIVQPDGLVELSES